MRSLASLRAAQDAASDLGLVVEVNQARELISRAEARLGFEGPAYVLALAGGTGVGKSSLLNALAGDKVSEVGVIRPTTSRPVAWVADDEEADVEPLLDWLGIENVVTHQKPDLAGVVILDLPDFDSVEVDHRATVDRLLPRIDAMLWVVESEKYDDELLHSYLRDLVVHADRIAFIFNKSDRLEPDEQSRISADFLRRLKLDGFGKPHIYMMSARTGAGLGALVERIRTQKEGKALVTEKLEADIARTLGDIAVAAGVHGQYSPLVDPPRRSEATAAATAGALSIVDPDGVAGQVKAAVLYRARRQGGSLLARILALLTNLTGTRRRSADPEGFLMGWRQRGSIGHVLNPIRRLMTDSMTKLPGPARASVMHKLEFDHVEERLTAAVEHAVRSSRLELQPARSPLWWVIGVGQLVLGAGFLFAIAWYLTLIFGPSSLPVGTVELPYLGLVPIPLALLAGSLAISLLLGLLLNLHASMIGRRRGRKVAAAVRRAVESTMAEAAFGPLDEVEGARQRIAAAINS